MEPWIIPLASMLVGLLSGGLGAYLGLKVGMAKLEFHSEDMREKLEKLTKRSNAYNDVILIHDVELEDVMRKLEMPRKRRQNWRFD